MTPRALGCALLLLAITSEALAAPPAYEVSVPQASTSQLVAASFARQSVALSDFTLRASDRGRATERSVQTLAVTPRGDGVLFGFGDGSARAPFAARARFVGLGSGVTLAEARRDGCAVSCELPIQPVADHRAFALTGFEIRSRSGAHRVRALAIQLVADQSSVRVTVAGPRSARSEPRFDAFVRYALVPKSALDGLYTLSGDFGKGRTSIQRRPGVYLLQGFSLELTGSERALHQLSISGSGRSEFEIVFSDQRGDAPYRASIDYAILK